MHIYIYIYIYIPRAHTHTHTPAHHSPPSFCKAISLYTYFPWAVNWIFVHKHVILSDKWHRYSPKAHRVTSGSAAPLSTFPVYPQSSPSVLFPCITVLNFIQYIWTICWNYIPSTHRHASNCGSSKKPTGSDYLQLPNKIISLYNVDQLHQRQVRDLALWATIYMLVSCWRLR
jgi:hypothetical protein